MEKSVNKVELCGFLGANPEVFSTKNGGKCVRLSLATNESYKNKSGEFVTDTTWHAVVVWNKLAEEAETTFKKGSCVALTGKIVNRTYDDKAGKKHYVTEVQALSFESAAMTSTKEDIPKA